MHESGDVVAVSSEVPMSPRKTYKLADENLTVGIRLTIGHLARADALIERIELDPMVTAAVPTPTRSLVLRMAMIEGLAILEARFPAARPASEAGKAAPHRTRRKVQAGGAT